MTLLVTGGSGTLGRAVCREAIDRGCRVVAYSRDRSRLLTECPQGTICETGDVTDLHRLIQVCREEEVDGIVHCAAMKHVGECEQRPDLTVETNIVGVQNVLRAATDSHVKRLVFVSSDKARDDTVYGMSKLLGERLVTEWAARHRSAANCVRLGNLIGSNGSVADLWLRAKAEGRPIRLDLCNGQAARRFAMHAWEAAEFVMGTLNCKSLGKVYFRRMPVLRMDILCTVLVGGPTETGDLAQNAVHQQLVRAGEPGVIWPDGPASDYSTRPGLPLTGCETKEWLANQFNPKWVCS